MKFLRLFAMDVREGFAALGRWYLVAAAFFALSIASLHLQAAFFRFDALRFTFGDYLVGFVAGMKPFDPNLGERFQFPLAWAVLFLLVAYLTLWYPYHDLMGSGKQVVVVGGSRWAWWLAKCAWVAVAVGAFFLIGMAIAAIWTLVSGGALSMRISEELPQVLQFPIMQGRHPSYDALPCLLLVPAATISLCLVQLFLSLVARPPLGYVATLSILFLSAFYFSPWLIGNYLMTARSASMMAGGVQTGEGVVLAAAMAAVVVVGGGFVFSHKDILNKEDLS